MKQNQIITKEEFIGFHEPLLKGYSETFKHDIASLDILSDILFAKNEKITIIELQSILENQTDIHIKSFLYRLLGTREILFCRDNDLQLDVKKVWRLISKSIRVIPSSYTISSIGSQGFLSIPLFKMTKH